MDERFTHNLCVSIKGSQIQRSSSVFIRVVDDRTFLHQELHNILMSFQTRPAERHQTLLVHLGQRSTFKRKKSSGRWRSHALTEEGFERFTFRQQKINGASVTLAGRHHEEGPALFVTDVDFSPVLQQELGDLRNKPT